MRVDVKKLFSIILILVLICTSVTIVYGGDNYITVRDVVNRLDKVAGSYNPQYTKEKLLSSSSFVLDEDVYAVSIEENGKLGKNQNVTLPVLLSI